MIGELVGNYEVLRPIGEGGMGAVYLAQHRLIGRRVAIKVLLPGASSNPEMVQRFFNEARSTSAIKHAGLIDVFDFGYHNGSAFLAMEFLEGESLATRLAREGRVRPELVAAVGRQVASAVGAANVAGIVHRDLKPDNIFLVPDDEVVIGVRAKVLDFGIAKLSGDHGASFKTRTGSLMGTPAYMSPEQCRGAAEVDARSDVYALGCILFEMATGRTPFVHDSIGPMMMAHMIDEPPPPRQLAPDLPEALEAVIRRAMAKRADDRYPTMEAVVAALGGRTFDGTNGAAASMFAAGTPSPSMLEAAATRMAVPTASAAPRRSRRRAILVAITTGGLVAAAIAAATSSMESSTAQQPATPAAPAPRPPEPPPPTTPTPTPERLPNPTPNPMSNPRPVVAAPAADARAGRRPTADDEHHRRKRRGASAPSSSREGGSAKLGAEPRPHTDTTIDPFAPPRKP